MPLQRSQGPQASPALFFGILREETALLLSKNKGIVMRHIEILDTTLRDGEQTPGVGFSLSHKTEIAKQLDRMGVDCIEAGFPASSEKDLEAVRAVSREVSCAVQALARCGRGIETGQKEDGTV